MVLVTTTIGYLLAGGWYLSKIGLFITLLGTALAAGGSAVLNNYLEREHDGRMARTKNRALPAGLVSPGNALAYGVVLTMSGVGLLAWKMNLLCAFIVLLTAFLYVLVYTPMKRVSWLNTTIGAIPGALPPVSGWVAATGNLHDGAWILFLILFAWQHPHFYAIAWMYKDDYAQAGYRMLPFYDPTGKRLSRQVIGYTLCLLIASVLPTLIGMTGMLYLVGSLILGAAMLTASVMMINSMAVHDARRLLRASIIYLPALLVLIVVDGIF